MKRGRGTLLAAAFIITSAMAAVAFADPITATVSGNFQNSQVITGDGMSICGQGCFTQFHDNFAQVGFSGDSVSADLGDPFVAGVLSFTAEPQSKGNVYTTELVLTTDADDSDFQGPTVLDMLIQTGDTQDLLELSDFPDAGELAVPVDGSTTDVELVFKFHSFDFVGFGDVTGNGVVLPNTTATPEPGTLGLLFLAGFAVIAIKKRKQIALH